jgi:DNA polymerase III alpha subunit
MMLSDNQESKMVEILKMIQDAVGADNVYLDIVAQDYATIPELKKINDQILDLGENTGIRYVVHNNYFYPSKDDKEAWEVALAIKDGKKMYDDDRRKPKGDYHIMSEEEIKAVMR